MNSIKAHKIISGIALVLCFSLLVPSAIKFLHIFENHQHEVCSGEHTTHFHSIDQDCEFYKFKINNPFTFFNENFTHSTEEVSQKKYFFWYSFTSTHQPLYFSLRAPPVNIV